MRASTILGFNPLQVLGGPRRAVFVGQNDSQCFLLPSLWASRVPGCSFYRYYTVDSNPAVLVTTAVKTRCLIRPRAAACHCVESNTYASSAVPSTGVHKGNIAESTKSATLTARSTYTAP